MVATCKAASTLTVAGEAQWQHDDGVGVGVDSYGATGYLSYALTPELAASLRGEVHRDNAGFFVLVHPGNLDATRASNGLPDTSSGEARQPCSERAWGVSYRPAIPHVALLAFRPDTRWNKSFSGGHPCIAGRQTGRFTVACGRDPRLPGKDARRAAGRACGPAVLYAAFMCFIRPGILPLRATGVCQATVRRAAPCSTSSSSSSVSGPSC